MCAVYAGVHGMNFAACLWSHTPYQELCCHSLDCCDWTPYWIEWWYNISFLIVHATACVVEADPAKILLMVACEIEYNDEHHGKAAKQVKCIQPSDVTAIHSSAGQEHYLKNPEVYKVALLSYCYSVCLRVLQVALL